MFLEFFRFELRYWFRGWMVYLFLAITTLMFFAAASSDQIVVGQAMGNTNRNAPFVIQMYYAVSGILCGLMVTAFVDSAASRDFTSKSSDLLFSKPISKFDYIFGRFLAAAIAAVVPTLGVSLGILIAKYMFWADPNRWGPVDWMAHLNSVLVFAIPNTLLFGSVVFAISVLTRSTLYAFIGTLLFIVAYAVSGSYLSDMENERLGAMLDPMGFGAFSIVTKYWAVEEKNTMHVGLSGLMLANRVVWMSVVATILGFAYWRFSFSEAKRPRDRKTKAELPVATIQPLPAVAPQADGFANHFRQFISHFRNDFRGVIRSTVFLVLLATCLLNMIPTLWFNSTSNYGQSSFPVTYIQVDLIRGTSLIFLIAIITFFAGVLTWRDRDVRSHEIVGALPFPNWTAFLSRFLTLAIIVQSMLLLGILVAVASQLASGYERLQIGLYVKELLVLDFARMSYLAILALLMHTLAPNKYVGYFLFIAAVIANSFVWNLLRVDTLLVKFGRLPNYTYSDLFEFQPYSFGLLAFGIYWSVFCLIIAWLCTQLAHRGVASPLLDRFRSGMLKQTPASRVFAMAAVAVWAMLGGWLYYNTHVLNDLIASKELEIRQVDYEKKYKSTEEDPLPDTTKIEYEIEIFPEQRQLVMKGTQDLVNNTLGPMESVTFTLAPTYETKMDIQGATLSAKDERLGVEIYTFDPPLQPGQRTTMSFEVKTNTRGIENSVSNIEINQNGSFFNNTIAPQIGYSSGREISDPQRRKKFNLPKTDGFPELTREKGAPCMRHYVGTSSWAEIETVISTSGDQIAVAPGSLVEEWTKDGRNYYRYRVDHPSLNFYSFISARFEVAREKWNDVDLEVYYHPEHHWNVPRMMESMKSALEYCSTSFGPYRHKQARIIEFPRIASFAQAFPGTMPYSESIGFIANLEDPDDIDFVFYVVAHEMAHQWWAHQVIGAKMQGATLLSETLAQYSALMIMEKHYGREMMRKFLKYEMDRYLSGRGSESGDEKPLLKVNPSQGYVHYQKGSVVMYYLKEMIGEERVNAALRSIVERFAYKDPPYPTSHDLVDELKKHIPEELQYLTKDLFEDITLFANRTMKAQYRKIGEDRYMVSIDIECQKLKSDGKGKSEVADLNDWIEIGAFAKPAAGRKYGEELYRQRVFIDKLKNTFEFEVSSVPDLVGVDPYFLLIDRMPEDNLKKAELIDSK